MVAGHLREKNGYYHMVLNYVDEYGKRHTPSKSTGLTVKGLLHLRIDGAGCFCKYGNTPPCQYP